MFGANFGNNPTFGGGGFPSSTANTGVFGQPQQQPVVSTSLFGGGFNQPKATFGSNFGASPQSSTMFGQPTRLPAPTTGGLFSGQTATVSPFSATGQTQVPAGTSIPFNAISGTDTMMKNGQTTNINTRHQCITCMKEYENKSLEELRIEDYQLNRKGPQQGSMFAQTQQQQSTGLFSSLGSTTATTPFGQTSTFGAPATSTSTSGWLFNSFSQQPKQTGSFFSTPTPTVAAPSAFGTNSGFSFGNQPTQTTSLFGTNNNTVTTGGLGATSGFSFGQQQPQAQSAGIFGAKQPLTNAPSTGFGTGGFGTSAFANTSTANKSTLGFTGFGTSTAPTFGTSTTNFGSGTSGTMFGGFQSQPQNKGFSFATPFSGQTQPTQPAFGAPNTSFSFNTVTSAPTMGFGTSTNTFGGLGNTMNSFSTPTFGSAQPNSFGFGLNPTSTQGFSSFTPSTMFTQAMPQQQNAPQPLPFGFATTPYKDSPLFYNLIANRDFENMIKPTSPAAQRAIKEASRRRTSTSLTFTSPGHISRNATFPTSHNFSKQLSIFDGFEDEDDSGFSIDILSPKTMVKKLTLKSYKHSFPSNHRHSISFTISPNYTANGFIDSDLSETHSGRGFDDCGLSTEGNSPSKVADEFGISQQNDRTGVPSQLLLNQKRHSGPQTHDAFEEHKCGVINTRAGYFVEPSLQELDKLMDDMGNCYVKGLVVGRVSHGEIRFLDVVNAAGINVDEIVHFRHKEVVVYPDDTRKPAVGSGLNCPALVCLNRVWPIDKVTKDPIKYPPQLQTMGYEDSLRRSCARLGAEFISYVPETGVWTFKVSHFSKYSCDVEEAEAESSVSKSPIPIKGLGGMLMQQSMTSSPLSRVRPQSTPMVPMATEDCGFASGDIEHNPLTPTDSNDSDSDWVPHDLNNGGNGQFESVLKGKSDTSAVRMMKSALMEHGDGIEQTEFQPPAKKFRSPLVRPKSATVRTVEINISAIKQRKSCIELKQRKHGPPGSALVALPEQSDRSKETSSFGTNYVATIVRRQESTSMQCGKEDLFSKLSLHTTNGTRYKGMPRVAFGPLGTFLTISTTSKTPSIVVSKFRSYSNQASDPVLLDVLEEQVKKQMSWPIPQVEDQIEVLLEYKVKLEHHHDPKSRVLQQELMMWELFQILWPANEEESPSHYLQTRDNISNWISKNSTELFPTTLGIDPHKSIFGLLKMGRRDDACKLAIKTRNPYLSLLMSQGALSKVTCSNCDEQLDVWETEEALNFVSEDIKTIYRLCSGKTILDHTDLSKMTTAEWLQHFAIYLWYCCPPHVPIHEAVSSFQHLLKNELASRTNWIEEEIRQFAFPSVCDASMPNLCVQLLKLYSFNGFPLRNVLDPAKYSADCLDYKLAWLLMVHLRVKNFKIYEEHFTSIATSFSHQLEQIGLYLWSVFVMSKTQDRTAYHGALVERNLGTWGTVEDETFLLINSLLHPSGLLFIARAMRELPGCREYGRIWYLLKSGNTQKAFNELQNFFTVDVINSKETVDSLLELMKLFKPVSHKIRNWHNRGSFMWDTLQLLKARSISRSADFEQDLASSEFYNLISNFFKSFVQYKPGNVNECALCIELAVVTQKIMAELMINDPDVGKNVGVPNASALFEIPIPKDYKDELAYFVNAWLEFQD